MKGTHLSVKRILLMLCGILLIGTVINAFCNGPLIQFFRGKIEKRVGKF